ncbi:MAG: hypothetical protein LBI42_08560 [Chitinispirillales bacterium]|jgi:uncharacterized repeat protein (TIGR04138 family)|nr:hypothetical protein [Chitinispirillales bacterium]
MSIPVRITEKIRAEIIESGLDDRYKTGAYEFVLNGLDFYITKIGEKRHVTGQELSMGLLAFAHKQYGLMAGSVLAHWGISVTDDFGYIVYNMIKIGLMSKQPNDTLDDFFDVMNVNSFFDSVDCFETDISFIKRVKGS